MTHFDIHSVSQAIFKFNMLDCDLVNFTVVSFKLFSSSLIIVITINGKGIS